MSFKGSYKIMNLPKMQSYFQVRLNGFLAIVWFFVWSIGFGQNKKLDSLWSVYNDTKHVDTNRLNAIDALAWSFAYNNPDSAFVLAKLEFQLAGQTRQERFRAKSLYLSGITFRNKGDYAVSLEYCSKALNNFEKIGDKKGQASCYNCMGNIYGYKSDFPKALEYFLKALKIFEETGDKKWQANCYNNIGGNFEWQSDFPKALEYHLKALKLREATGDKNGIGMSYDNIGEIFGAQAEYSKALEYYQKALKINLEIGNKRSIGYSYNDIGSVYKKMSDFPKALDNYMISIKMYQEAGDINEVGSCYSDIGNIYGAQMKFDKALEYQFKALKIKKEIGNEQGMGNCYSNISTFYLWLLNFNLAIQYADSGLKIGKRIGSLSLQLNLHKVLATAFAKTGHFKDAYENHVRFKLFTDSIFSTDKSKQLGDMKTRFEVEKKESELKGQAEVQQKIAFEEKKRQRTIIYGVAGILMIVIVFSVFLFRRFKITQKQKKVIERQKDEVDKQRELADSRRVIAEEQKLVIEKQKHIVEEHQKEMVDSITYAKRLQKAILPRRAEIHQHFPNSFVLYLPKDIVAGDFYWMHSANDVILIAAADCTGHGVPGALVSVVCSNALNRTVKEFRLFETGRILDKVTELVLETFEKSGEEIKDGMDISLLSINRITNQVQWSGANNPLWIVKNGELTEIKADKQPIGRSEDRKSFTSHVLPLTTGETFYLITDGYADQFSRNDKKLMKKKFKELLLFVQDKSLAEQKEFLEDHHNRWKGTMEQTDDVTVIGIKI